MSDNERRFVTDDERNQLRRSGDGALLQMVQLAIQGAADDAKEAKGMIASHIKECADNYRRLTMAVIATLVTSLVGMAVKLVDIIVVASHH